MWGHVDNAGVLGWFCALATYGVAFIAAGILGLGWTPAVTLALLPASGVFALAVSRYLARKSMVAPLCSPVLACAVFFGSILASSIVVAAVLLALVEFAPSDIDQATLALGAIFGAYVLLGLGLALLPVATSILYRARWSIRRGRARDR